MKNAEHVDLISSLKKGHVKAYSFIYETYYNKLFRYVYSLSQSTELAEDVAQSVLMKLWENKEELHFHTSLNAYLYKCAFNDFANKSKSLKRRSILVEELRAEAIRESEYCNADLDEERLLYLQKAIENLPPKRKEIFILHKLKNYKYKEIAILRNISERTVESQIRKAMLTLKQEASKYEIIKMTLLFFSWSSVL